MPSNTATPVAQHVAVRLTTTAKAGSGAQRNVLRAVAQRVRAQGNTGEWVPFREPSGCCAVANPVREGWMNPELTEAVSEARAAFLTLHARLREIGQYESVEQEFDRLRLAVTDVIERAAERA